MNPRWLGLAAVACAVEGPIDDLGINEIGAGTADADFVEVMNASGTERSLEGWSLRVEDRSYDFVEPSVAAMGFATIDGLALADEGGVLALVDPDGGVVDEVTFPATEPEEGFGRVPDAAPNWQRLMELTPGGPNR